MSNVNSGSMVGNIVSDIIVKAINDDLSVVQFRVAPSNNRETDSPIPVVAYNGVGERVSQQFKRAILAVAMRWLQPPSTCSASARSQLHSVLSRLLVSPNLTTKLQPNSRNSPLLVSPLQKK